MSVTKAKGRTAADVFRKAIPKADAPSTEGRGDRLSRVTVILRDSQCHRLDRIALAAREKTGQAIRRAAIIRAMVDAVDEAGVDLTECGSETEVRERIVRALRAN